MNKNALVVLANGTEELEFVIIADLLDRAGINVTTAGLPDCSLVTCSRGIKIQPHIGISDAKSRGVFDIIVLPGGRDGAITMGESKYIGELLRDQEKSGRFIAAICAGPMTLKAHGICQGKNVTSYPSTRAVMEDGNYKYSDEDVVMDGSLITGKGPSASFEFSLKIIETLMGKEKAAEVADIMLLSYNSS